MSDPLLASGPVLAKELDEFTVTPGVLGFVVFAVLGIAVWVLLKSMTKQLNRVDFKATGSHQRTPWATGGQTGPQDRVPQDAERTPGPRRNQDT